MRLHQDHMWPCCTPAHGATAEWASSRCPEGQTVALCQEVVGASRVSHATGCCHPRPGATQPPGELLLCNPPGWPRALSVPGMPARHATHGRLCAGAPRLLILLPPLRGCRLPNRLLAAYKARACKDVYLRPRPPNPHSIPLPRGSPARLLQGHGAKSGADAAFWQPQAVLPAGPSRGCSRATEEPRACLGWGPVRAPSSQPGQEDNGEGWEPSLEPLSEDKAGGSWPQPSQSHGRQHPPGRRPERPQTRPRAAGCARCCPGCWRRRWPPAGAWRRRSASSGRPGAAPSHRYGQSGCAGWRPGR